MKIKYNGDKVFCICGGYWNTDSNMFKEFCFRQTLCDDCPISIKRMIDDVPNIIKRTIFKSVEVSVGTVLVLKEEE